ncbi:MAG: EF-hand domain-containing protein [Pseudorhodobacter sp.]|nr:EF-hand domain-containing protein [Pseudorhodobacter sp.]
MKLTSKMTGFGITAVAGLMMCTAAIADSMGKGDMGPGHMGPGMDHMGGMPSLEGMDANKDGKVSKEEVTAFRAAQTASVDANKDGKLSVDELAAMHLKAMTDAAKSMAQRMVDRLDTDGDGMLSAAELIGQPMPTNMFDTLDTNKDGFIDQAELDAGRQAMMQRSPSRDGGRGGHHPHPIPDAPDQPAPDLPAPGGN